MINLFAESCSTDADLPSTASFLGNHFFTVPMPAGQRRELIRLESQDLIKRYSNRNGSNKYPSALLLAEEDNELVGCIGLDCRLFSRTEETMKDIRTTSEYVSYDEAGDYEIIVALANLAVRVDKRGLGYAKKLVRACDPIVKSWGYNDIYLMVDSKNTAAQKLYFSEGYKLVYKDLDASRLAPGSFSLRTESCVNFCCRKTGILKSSSQITYPDWKSVLSTLFNQK